MKNQSYNYFTIRLNNPKTDKINAFCQSYDHYAYIIHDKDIFKDTDENHNAGDKKAPHAHILLNLRSGISLQGMRKKVNDFFPKSSPRVEVINSAKGSADYLTHSTEQAIKDNKFRYPESDIISDKLSYWYEKETQDKCKKQKDDWTVKFFDELIHNGLNSSLLRQYISDYGRDFIFNFNKVYDCSKLFKHLKHKEENRFECLELIKDDEKSPFDD